MLIFFFVEDITCIVTFLEIGFVGPRALGPSARCDKFRFCFIVAQNFTLVIVGGCFYSSGLDVEPI